MIGSSAIGVALLLLRVFGGLSLALVVLLISMRVARMLLHQVDQARAAALRSLLLTLVLGGPEEADAAERALSGRRGAAWRRAEDHAFAMLPKLKGDSRRQISALLRSRGAAVGAIRLTRSPSTSRRCRGAFRLGLLGDPAHVDVLVPLLQDASPLVRRVTARALGALGNPQAVVPLLEALGDVPGSGRDLIHALHRIGLPGAPVLRECLAMTLEEPSHHPRRAGVAATTLGHLEDIGSVTLLVRALDCPDEEVAVAAMGALGRIGSPEAIPALTGHLFDHSETLRLEATRALGAVGSSVAGDALLEVLESNDPAVARDAAHALVKLGPSGMHLLEASSAPYAVEAVALTGMGRRVL